MKECLHCQKEFEPIKPTRKYCSDSCRVMYNRKYGKKEEIKPIQMQSLYNQIVELMEKFNHPIDTSILGIRKENNGVPTAISSTTKRNLTVIRSPEQWHELKRGCESTEEWQEVKQQIMDAGNLTDKQKQLIFNTP